MAWYAASLCRQSDARHHGPDESRAHRLTQARSQHPPSPGQQARLEERRLSPDGEAAQRARTVAVPEHHGTPTGAGRQRRARSTRRRGPPRPPRPRRETSSRRSKSSRVTPTSMPDELGSMSDADFRTEIKMFGNQTTKGAFIVNLVLGGCAAYRTQLFVYLKACGREELSTMNLWAGVESSSGRRLVRPATSLAVLCASHAAWRRLPARRTAQPAPAPQQADPKAPPPRFRLDGEHPTLRVGDLEVVFRARLETAFRTGSPVEEGLDVDLRRRRVQVEGSYKRLEYEFSHEFGDPMEPERDAFVNMRFSRPLRAAGGPVQDAVRTRRPGQQRQPGLRLPIAAGPPIGAWPRRRGDGARAAVRRASPTTPRYFVHDGDNARSRTTHGGRRAVAGRLEMQPFTARKGSALEQLEVGVAVVQQRARRRAGAAGGNRVRRRHLLRSRVRRTGAGCASAPTPNGRAARSG